VTFGSNLGRRSRIGRLGGLARGSGGGTRRRPSSATALRGSSPDLAKLGRPGVKSTRIWVWGDLRGTCSPPGTIAGLGEVPGGASKGGGGSARWRITGASVRVVLGLESGWGLVEERVRGKANSSRGTRRHVGALAWRAAVQGGAGGRGSPAAVF